jgi:hypothetical protein
MGMIRNLRAAADRRAHFSIAAPNSWPLYALVNRFAALTSLPSQSLS